MSATQTSPTHSYYGRPILKEPVWTWEIPAYFFTGGLAGASATLGLVADVSGNQPLARSAWTAALAGVAASPAFLISDLGRPERFLNMLRVFKITSPMSVGTWILTAAGGAFTASLARVRWQRLTRIGAAGGALGGAVLGPALSTYTAVLVADTAIPAWHEARRQLPFVFAGSSMGAAGAAACILTPVAHAAPARRLAVAGAVLEGVASQVMERHLGPLGRPYHEGASGRFSLAAKTLTVSGAATIARFGRRRAAAAAGGSLLLGGSLCERFAVYHAGIQSARDPRATVGPQRARTAAATGAPAASAALTAG
ncbi:MAG: NrfD/PsrC family molybdoenzyme membrane anchor subunit [Solirubrobacteraceae bacterium]